MLPDHVILLIGYCTLCGGAALIFLGLAYLVVQILYETLQWTCKVTVIHKEVVYFIVHRQAIRAIVRERKNLPPDIGLPPSVGRNTRRYHPDQADQAAQAEAPESEGPETESL